MNEQWEDALRHKFKRGATENQVVAGLVFALPPLVTIGHGCLSNEQ